MTESELKMVADDMGHTVKIHSEIYQLQSSMLERSKVARILNANENCIIGKFAGCSLDSITMASIDAFKSFIMFIESGADLFPSVEPCPGLEPHLV